jgi:steroid delta-isomerase-like uncharacterized protein
MMSSEKTRSIARAILDAADRRDVAAMAAAYRDDVQVEWLPVGVFRGKQTVSEFWAQVFAAVPDSRLAVTNLIVEGDQAIAEWRWTGTFSGSPYIGIHATGHGVDFRGCDVMRFVDGLLSGESVYFDGLRWARQIGMLPSEGGLADRAMTAAFNTQTEVRALARRLGERIRHTAPTRD